MTPLVTVVGNVAVIGKLDMTDRGAKLSVTVAVPRKYFEGGVRHGSQDYVQVVVRRELAERVAAALEVGDKVIVTAVLVARGTRDVPQQPSLEAQHIGRRL